MQVINKHILLIGFKHVGKSTVGKYLAKTLNKPFYDLDKVIENEYERENGIIKSCREIMQEKGEKFFRQLEIKSLVYLLKKPLSVVSCGGGVLMDEESQQLVRYCLLVNIRGKKQVVFARIKKGGQPAFFGSDGNMRKPFDQLWERRNKVYSRICDFSVSNNKRVEDVVGKIIEKMNRESYQ